MGEGESLYASQRHIPPPNLIVIPAPTVIPAKAGIHPPAFPQFGGQPGFWIPAYAGMTVEAQATKSPPFAKGGLWGFYTYTYTYTPPETAANLLLR